MHHAWGCLFVLSVLVVSVIDFALGAPIVALAYACCWVRGWWKVGYALYNRRITRSIETCDTALDAIADLKGETR